MKRRPRLGNLAFTLLAALCISSGEQAASGQPLPESASSIEYESVADALTALRAKPGVVFTTENGWLVATDRAAYSIWSFAPKDYPAYPAVVKRWVIPQKVGSDIEMDVLCEASKEACDDLVRTFAKMNNLPLPQ